MNELMLSLLLWIGNNSDNPVERELPNIRYADKYEMCLAYGISNPASCDHTKLMAFFNKGKTIYLRDDFDLHDPNDRARLLHELVHFAQWESGKHEHNCLGHLEVEAYELQEHWRLAHGLEPQLDPFKQIMLVASCDA